MFDLTSTIERYSFYVYRRQRLHIELNIWLLKIIHNQNTYTFFK